MMATEESRAAKARDLEEVRLREALALVSTEWQRKNKNEVEHMAAEAAVQAQAQAQISWQTQQERAYELASDRLRDEQNETR